MTPIRVRRTVDSETLHLPELRGLVGRQVEIVITELSEAEAERLRALDAFLASGPIEYDVDAFWAYREFNRVHGQPPEL